MARWPVAGKLAVELAREAAPGQAARPLPCFPTPNHAVTRRSARLRSATSVTRVSELARSAYHGGGIVASDLGVCAMPDFGELFDKAKDLASEHPDQVHQGIDKVQELAEDHLGSQFEGQIEKAGDLAEGFLGVRQTPDDEGQSDQNP